MINNFSPLLKSAFLLCSGLFIFGLADNFIILISDKVSVGQFHFSRSLVACLAVLVIAYYFKESLIPKNIKMVLLRTIFNVIAMILYFGVIPMMPIAEAGAGLFTSPIFVLLFSYLFFGEKISIQQLFSFLIGLVGVFLILGTKLSSLTIYHLLPILAGASYATGTIFTNRFCKEENPLSLLFIFLISIGVSGFLVSMWFTYNPAEVEYLNSAPFIFMSWQKTNLHYWSILIFLGLSAALAIYLIIYAYQIYKPSYSSIFEYTYLISAGFFGWLFWNQIPSLMSFIGILAVIIAGVNIALSEINSKKDFN